MPQQRFYNATDKLINAFIIGTLNHDGSCSCAVGQMCNGQGEWWWGNKAVIQESEYSDDELLFIEAAFENRTGRCHRDSNYIPPKRLSNLSDPDGFIGLCKVFDYLVSIEDWSEEESKVNLVEMCLANVNK